MLGMAWASKRPAIVAALDSGVLRVVDMDAAARALKPRFSTTIMSGSPILTSRVSGPLAITRCENNLK